MAPMFILVIIHAKHTLSSLLFIYFIRGIP